MDQKIEVAGQFMPAVGLGLWKIDQTQTAETVYNAIRIGYRHLDSIFLAAVAITISSIANLFFIGESIKDSRSIVNRCHRNVDCRATFY